MTPRPIVISLLASCCVALISIPAQADDALVARREESRVDLATWVWPTSNFTVATTAVESQIVFNRNFALDLTFPNWGFGDAHGRGYAAFGGVGLGAHGVGHLSADSVVWGGVQVTVPTTWDRPSDRQLPFLVSASAVRASFFQEGLLPEILTLRFPVGTEVKAGPGYLRADIAPTAYLPVGQATGKGVLDLETSLELEARSNIGVGGGLRFQALFVLADGNLPNNADHAQTALEPFIGYEAPGDKPGFTARLGLLMALDTPLGFAFDKNKLAALDIAIGWRF